jgi:UDP-glucuronate decarboxylase
MVMAKTGSRSQLVFQPLPQDDPLQRKPDIALAKKYLGWEPRIALSEGLDRTITFFRQELGIN